MADALGRGPEVLFATTLVVCLLAVLSMIPGSVWFVLVVSSCTGLGTALLTLARSPDESRGSASAVFGDGNRG
ncbi:hypothetical protein [Salinigranum sp. GCM10025319]|uniref:hypothetical protein n=1 Tax=Salinigranum sp. GCM10025319 TaxID=3252687 RepID=UPI003618154B